MGPKDTVENELNLREGSLKGLLGWFPPAWRCRRQVVSLSVLGWSPGEHTKDTSSIIVHSVPDYGHRLYLRIQGSEVQTTGGPESSHLWHAI